MARRRRSSLVAIRRGAQRVSTVTGHARALSTGRVPQRVVNYGIGRLLGRAMRGRWF